ncbi:LysM peptidoglycan-binding domain-containing protein [Caminibacter mediatlanticus TB-2]|uniref:LysM peptidoglycan-binding domain-containing protein n=2 Tax=Caminibacter mediatlanticus TB-2 TaxID=391592 RepID=A0ABX5VB15_9BACT|nr:lytic transglycosylase domain-containing protein [Caminibacter mediatlanticus]QCT94769.1 LysM peptidoglycan-binding domain-containing protein [Caminibacter mediatlanticus TB-2]
MKKFLFIFIFNIFLFADILNQNNLNVLRALDINEGFLYYKPLKEKYDEYYYRKKRYFINILENGYDILPIIRKSILKSNIPSPLISVAMAESYFTLNAKSHKKATGLWQFMPSTAKKFGLKIDEYVDERRDPIKSTKAAIEYLKYLHKFFGKWYLAVMAYNAGEARVVEAVVRAKVDKLCEKLGKKCKKDKRIKEYRKIIRDYQREGRKKFLPLYKLYKKLDYIQIDLEDLLRFQKGLKRQYLPKETRDYILKVLALSFLFSNDEFLKYSNSYILNSGVTPEFVRVNVSPGTSLYYVARFLNINYKNLRKKNMQLKYSFTPPYKYYIYIPYKKLAFFKTHFKSKGRFLYVYKVKKGDTLLKIAKMYGIKVKMIKDYNKLGKYLRVNQKLIIPLNERFVKYKVKPGDTLNKIALKFGVSYKKIKRINRLKSNIIRVGEVIKIPQKL